jgi:predicted DNA-binding transcriptional regulator AlpA
MRRNQSTQSSPGRAIRLPEVCRLTAMSRATVWRLARHDSSFPKPFKLTDNITCWAEDEILGWIACRKTNSAASQRCYSPSCPLDDKLNVLA